MTTSERQLIRQISWYLKHRPRHCFYCGLLLFGKAGQKSSNHRTRDHVIPRSRGGKKVVPACHSCNQAKGSSTLEEFRALRYGQKLIEFFGETEYRRRDSAVSK